MTHGTGIKVGDRVRAPGQAAGVVVSVLDMGVLGRTCLSVRLDGGGAGLYEPADLQRESVKIGDTVAWADVPDGAMVREREGDCAVRHVYSGVRGNVTIIALGLTGFESAEDLQRMAEVFDGWRDLCERTGWDREMAWGNAVALHGFGWRAGLPFVASKFVRATEDRSIEAANEPTWEQP